MSISNSQKLLFLALALSVILACNSLAPAAPQPAATLDALYTAAAETLNALSTQGANISTIQPPQPRHYPSQHPARFPCKLPPWRFLLNPAPGVTRQNLSKM